MCSSDTIGPGGIFRALREVAARSGMARDARKLSPDAWVINFVNPTTVLGIALHALRAASPQLRALRRQPRAVQYAQLCKRVGILPADATAVPPEVCPKLDLAIGGVNHCTWVVRFRYDGKDMMPRCARRLVAGAQRGKGHPGEHSKARHNYALRAATLRPLRRLPDRRRPHEGIRPLLPGLRRPRRARRSRSGSSTRTSASGRWPTAWKVTEQYAAGEAQRKAVPEDDPRRPRHRHHREHVGRAGQVVLHQHAPIAAR